LARRSWPSVAANRNNVDEEWVLGFEQPLQELTSGADAARRGGYQCHQIRAILASASSG
jgi:hypothetical protein